METQMSASNDVPEYDAAMQRHCGRCQKPFATDPSLWFQTDWGLCPACDEILLGKPTADTKSPG